MAGTSVWVDVLPSLRRFGPDLTRGATSAAARAGQTAGRAMSAAMNANTGTAAAKKMVDDLQVASKRAARIVQSEKAAIQAARSAEKAAAQNVAAAEARLAEQRAKHGAAASQALKAEASLTTVRGRQQQAALKVTAVEDQLRAAYNEQKAVTGQLTRAQSAYSTAQSTAAKGASPLIRGLERTAALGGPVASGLGRAAAGAKAMAGAALATLKPLASMAGGFAAIIGVQKVISLGNEYTRTMNELQAVTNASDKQMRATSATARALGSDLTLPATSGADAAAIMVELAKGGLTLQGSMAAAKGTIQLAAAAQVDGATAAEIQANALNQFSLSADKAGMVADVLANTANAAAGGVTDIATSMKYVGPVAASLGISIADTASSIGLLANQGLKGDTAGTALRGMLASLARPSKQAQKGVDALGLSVFDSQGRFVGMRKVIESLSDAQKTMTQEQFATNAVLAFGREPLAAVTALATQGTKSYDNMSLAVTRQGGAAAVAQSQMKGLGGAMDKLESQLEDVALGIYQTVTPALTAAVTGIAGGLDGAGAKVQSFLNIAGGIGKLVFTGQATPDVAKLLPVQPILQARTIIIDGVRDVVSFVQSALLPAFKNAAVALTPLAVAAGVVLVGAFRAVGFILANVVGPVLVGVTGFFRDNQWATVVLATAVGTLVAAYVSMQVVPGIIGGVTAAITVAKRVQEGFALASYGAAAAMQAQGLAGKAGAAGFVLYNAALRVGAALTFAYKVATLGWKDAVLAQRAVTVGATATQWAFNAALTANPIGLIVVAIVAVVAALAALVAGVIYAYNHWTWFRTAVDAVWSAIQVGAKAVGAAAVWLWQNVMVPAWQGIAAAAQWAWNTILKPTFDGVMLIVRAVAAVFSWWWQNITMPVFRGIVAVISWFWNTVSAIFDLAVAIIRFTLAPVFTLLAATASLAWRGIVASVKWAWGIVSATFSVIVAFVRGTLGVAFAWLNAAVVQPVFSAITRAVQIGWIAMRVVFSAISSFLRATLGPVFNWLYTSVIKPVFGSIRTLVTITWTAGLKPIFDKIASFAKVTIPAAFGVMKAGIKSAWDAISNTAKAPIKFVVNTVINDALIGNFNKVAGVFGTKKIDKISLPKGFAGGGIVPGYSSVKRDDHLRPMRAGEGVLVPEVVRALGPGFVHSLNAAGNAGGVGAVRNLAGYAKGGIVGAVTSGWDWVKGAAGNAWDWGKNAAETAANVVTDPMGTLGKLVKSVLGKIPGSGRMVDAASGMATKTLTAAIDALKKIGDSGAGTGKNGDLPKSSLMKVSGFAPGPGVGAMGGYLRIAAARAWQAMQQASGKALGLTEGYRDIANQNKRWAMYKAGGNLAALPGTSVHGLGNAADIGAGQAWARANGPRYGWYNTGLSFSQREPWHFEYKGAASTGAGRAGSKPVLYDNGGMLPVGMSLVANKTGKPEPVFTDQQFQAMRAGAATEKDGDVVVHAYVGGTGNHAEDVRDLRRAVRARRKGIPV